MRVWRDELAGRSVLRSAGCFDQGRIMASGHLSPWCEWDIGTDACVCVCVRLVFLDREETQKQVCSSGCCCVCVGVYVYMCICVYVYMCIGDDDRR